MRFVFSLALVLLILSPSARTADHIWSKNGTAVYPLVAKDATGKVAPREVYSPDHSKRIEVTFAGDNEYKGLGFAFYTNKRELELPLNGIGLPVEAEILWSPDSQRIALTGKDTGTENWTRIFKLEGEKLQLVALQPLQKDMANTYPLCEGRNVEEKTCHTSKNGGLFNYATIAWADATTAVVMREIPCSSSEGGMMCQVEGYELDVRSGHILRRMTARELKKRWQSKVAWHLRVPSPPYLNSKTLNASGPK